MIKTVEDHTSNNITVVHNRMRCYNQMGDFALSTCGLGTKWGSNDTVAVMVMMVLCVFFLLC
jgi:hypothetical protein